MFVQRQDCLHRKMKMRSVRFFLSCYQDRTESLQELSLDSGYIDMDEKALRRNEGLAGPAAVLRGHEDTDTTALRGSFRSPSIEGIQEPTAEQLTCSGSGTLPREAPVALSNYCLGTEDNPFPLILNPPSPNNKHLR